MSNPPSGTPQPHRRRRRDLSGTPIAILGMLMQVPRGRLDPDLASIACQTTRGAIIQAIHRLRDQGLVIITHPTPPGPFRVQWYMLHHESRHKAWKLLTWWAEPNQDIYAHYKKLIPPEEPKEEPTYHDQPLQHIIDVEQAHTAALIEAGYRRTQAAINKAIKRTNL